MTFEEKLNELVNKVEVPDELSPENIAAMLKARTAQSHTEAADKNIKAAENYSAQRRKIIMRTAAAIAACAVFAAGMISYSEKNNTGKEIEEQIDYSAVSPDSYDDLYNIYTGIYLDGTSPAPASSYKNKDAVCSDMTKDDGKYLYCATDGYINIISLEDMTTVSQIDLNGISPADFYVDGDTLTLISEETVDIQSVNSPDVLSDINPDASDVPAEDADNSQTDKTDVNSEPEQTSANSRTNVVVDLYSISDKTNPVHLTAYKQNGSYTSSRITDGALYVISDYSDYRSTPLAKDADLDTFVPAYYIGGKKIYIAAGDIIVPALTNSTDYTVVSALSLNGADTTASVKAVLGSSENVYCIDNAIYIAGTGRNSDGTDFSVISKFDLDSDGISYKASGSIAGRIIDDGMSEYNGLLRTASVITDDKTGITSVSVYVLDSTITSVNSAGSLLSGQNVSSVRFEGNYASFFTDGSAAALVIDLSSTPPSQVEAETAFSTGLTSFSDTKAFGIEANDEGILTLTMFDSVNGGKLSEISFGENGAELGSSDILADSERAVIGIPVCSHNEFGTTNEYYVFSFDDENGLAQKGVITYNDIDDSCKFNDAVIQSDVLYISGGRRIVSVQLSDMKVISTYEF